MSRPFLWGWAAASIVCFILLLQISARRPRSIALIAFGVAFAMFLAEAVAAVSDARRSANGSITSEYSPPSLSKPDHELGRGSPLGDTWLFIGCSFTFGEGVEDDETLPAGFPNSWAGRRTS